MPNSGSFGSDSLSANGVLSPPPQPTIDEPYNSTVRAGHTAQFQCKVQWRKDALTIRVSFNLEINFKYIFKCLYINCFY